MGDLKDPRLIYLKGFLFLIAGGLAAAGILFEAPKARTAVLLGLAIWAFCRAYYFAFYVIEHYIDPSYRFAELSSVIRYALKNRSEKDSSK